MKAFFSALVFVFVSYSAFASDEGQIVEPIDQEPSIEGNWEFHSRYCYSGAPVRDAYVPGRDTMELNFAKTAFRSFSDVQGCIGYAKGEYELRNNNIVLHIDNQVNSCNPNRFAGTVVNAYSLTPRRLTVTVGPFRNGGPCPMNDSMGVVYKRFQ